LAAKWEQCTWSFTGCENPADRKTIDAAYLDQSIFTKGTKPDATTGNEENLPSARLIDACIYRVV